MAGYDATIEVLPNSGFLDLQGDAAVRQVLDDALETSLPMAANCLVRTSDNHLIYCISPDHWILQVDDGQQSELLDLLEREARDLSHSFVDVSDMYAQIRLSGLEARHVLAQGVSIDLHPRVFSPGSTARTGFAKTTAQLYCVDNTPTYIITVYSSYRQYAVDWLQIALGANRFADN